MAYRVELAAGETLELEVVLNLSKKAVPFQFAITNRAIYVPRVKLIAKTDPYYFQRVGLEEVHEVIVKRLPPYSLWFLSGIMIVAGLITSALMLEPLLKNTPGFRLANRGIRRRRNFTLRCARPLRTRDCFSRGKISLETASGCGCTF